jgi:hypothetical protein
MAARALVVFLALLFAAPASAEDPPAAPAAPVLHLDPDVRRYAPRELHLQPPDLALVPTEPPDRSFLFAAGESVLANFLIWSWSRWVREADWAQVTADSIRDNLDGPWVFDQDDFVNNQFGHPYHGSLNFAAARSAGLNFWQSIPYPVVMSTLWELFAEIEPPSINDAITTPVAGIFLGEVLHRLYGEVLDGGGARPGAWRQLGAAAISPMDGLTRLAVGDRFRSRETEPIPRFIELRLGGSFGGYSSGPSGRDETGGMLSLGIQVTHGLPVPGWRLRRPFDHFDFTASLVATERPWGVLWVRGLLAGRDYGSGLSRGFAGLYGIFETSTPEVFRASTSALGVGTTGQLARESGFALSGTAILGLGFGAAGARDASTDVADYHYGMNTLAILEARLVAADRGALRLSARQYYIGGLVSPVSEGHELVTYASVGATLRVIGRHAVGLDATVARREAGFPDAPDTLHRFSQMVAHYAYVNDKMLGSGLAPSGTGPR